MPAEPFRVRMPATAGARARFPAAFVLSLVLVALVELVVRQIPARKLIAYERGVPARFAVKQHLDAYGPAEVVFVGSSRVQMGILCPDAAADLRACLGRDFSVANYASGGALIQELAPTIKVMLAHGHPKVLLFGVDPEQVRGPEMYNDRSAIFWNLADWWEARERFGRGVDRYLPTVVRDHLGDVCHLLRYRTRPLHFLKASYRGREPSPILGEMEPGQVGPPGQLALTAHPADEVQVKHHVDTAHLIDGKYPFNPEKVGMFAEVIRDCRAAGTRVVLFECPNAEVFNKFLPADVYPRFYGMMRELAAAEGATFVSLEEMGLGFTDEEFSDPVHLNARGAAMLTKRVIEVGAAPALR